MSELHHDYADFCDAVRRRESSNNYACVNSLGYVGAYQFGLARLCDLGLTERIKPGYANTSFRWKEPMTRTSFLASKNVQDACFDLHVQKLKEQIREHNMPLPFSCSCGLKPFSLDLSGAIGVCHLLGFGGLYSLVKRGRDEMDGYGTRASSYGKLFSGYLIP